MSTSPPLHRLAIHPDTAAASIELALVPPPWLDARTRLASSPDPVRQAWDETVEAFVHLQALRTIELLRTIVSAMPPGEELVLEWEYDEVSTLWLRFANGWQAADSQLAEPDVPTFRYLGEKEATAPDWYPRDAAGLQRWKHWHNLLSCWSVSPEVHGKVDERLEQGLDAVGRVLSEKTLPPLEKALLSGSWAAALEASRLAGNLPQAQRAAPRRGKARL